MRTLSRPVIVSIATSVFDIVVLLLSVVYVLYLVYETLAYYGLGLNEWLYVFGRRLGVAVAVVSLPLGALFAALIGQILGRRWALWLAVVMHLGMAALCVFAFVSGGFEIASAVVAVAILLSNLAAAVFLVVLGRDERAGDAAIPGPPPPPVGFG